MTNDHSNRRGSALLIVLGMLSFMIVSAVAFSVYMRMSRAPSSYLRRNVATQHLTRAALARAIEEIDNHIGNDPYPGFGDNATEERTYSSGDGYRYKGREDAWTHRVFCPYADSNGDTIVKKNTGGSSSDSDEHCICFKDTVAVLSLETLGYIPTPLVNQVRYWSRRSATARWKRFNYDLGRWAYTAVNVSDYFDVNATRAYTNRNSGAFGRISLYPLLKELGDEKTAEKFDAFIKRMANASEGPLMSVMDFNLAITDENMSKNLVSPFCKWIGEDKKLFYDGFDFNVLSNAVFLTDCWYPSTNQFAKGGLSRANCYFLSDPNDQPFVKFDNMQGFPAFVSDSNSAAGESYRKLFKTRIGAVGGACLYDYLDGDSVPQSLALPCTEQVPMIVGISSPGTIKLDFNVMKKKNETPAPATGETPPPSWTFGFKMNKALLQMATYVIFPFKRQEMPGTFRVQALVRVYFGPHDMPIRVKGSGSSKSGGSPLHPEPEEWTGSRSSKFNDAKCFYTFVSAPAKISLPSADVLADGNGEKALTSVSIDEFEFERIENDDAYHELFTYQQAKDGGKPTVTPSEKFIPYNKENGKASAWNGSNFPGIEGNVVPNVSVWMRVLDETGKTVDLVPATFHDDRLNWSTALVAEQLDDLSEMMCGKGVPLLNFRMKDGDGNFSLPSKVGDMTDKNLKLFFNIPEGEESVALISSEMDDSDYKSLACYDPRYNFAPEDWYSSDKVINEKVWYDNVKKNLLGRNGRDADVFMFVSNQEYMQSLGELAFIPQTKFLKWGDSSAGDSSGISGDFYLSGRYRDSEKKTFVDLKDSDPSKAANYKFFWRTYCSYDQRDYDKRDMPERGDVGGDGIQDPIYELTDSEGKPIFDDEGIGPRVSPYTDNDRIFMLAIENTPCDYWAASTNKAPVGPEFSNPEESFEYAFSEKSKFDKLTQQEINSIGQVIRDKLCAQKDGNWLAAYDELDWHGLAGADNYGAYFLNSVGKTDNSNPLKDASINEVDRKFLYSFWRNCFGNRQQLFLVFVRAEPNVFGGAQQGSRAVALVWRDPAPPVGYANHKSRQYELVHNESSIMPPHRTRILFYHQFE